MAPRSISYTGRKGVSTPVTGTVVVPNYVPRQPADITDIVKSSTEPYFGISYFDLSFKLSIVTPGEVVGLQPVGSTTPGVTYVSTEWISGPNLLVNTFGHLIFIFSLGDETVHIRMRFDGSFRDGSSLAYYMSLGGSIGFGGTIPIDVIFDPGALFGYRLIGRYEGIGITPETGDKVGSWPNARGSNPLLATGDERPDYIPAQLGGLPAVHFAETPMVLL